MLPIFLSKVYTIVFLILIAFDFSVLLIIFFKTQMQSGVVKFSMRISLVLLIFAPVFALVTKVYVTLT